MTTLAPLIDDPADAAVRRNPFPLDARLQDEDPVHGSPALRAWVLTRYADVRQMMLPDTLLPDRLRPFYAQLQGERRGLLAKRCIGRLVERFPRIERIERATGAPDWIDGLAMRGVASLPVQLG